jgi:hypothetical protein
MRRRQFITLLGGATVSWPLAARAQQPERMRRIGVLLAAAADDVQFQAWVGAFLQGLALLGWTIGRNVRIDTRWATANAAEIRRHAAELVALDSRQVPVPLPSSMRGHLHLRARQWSAAVMALPSSTRSTDWRSVVPSTERRIGGLQNERPPKPPWRGDGCENP